jgi:CDP-diglyceride synthetase
VIGGSCLLAAFILWLHQWMPWWQCFGAGGIVAIVCGVVGYTIASGLAARNRTEKPASTLPIPESTISHYEK